MTKFRKYIGYLANKGIFLLHQIDDVDMLQLRWYYNQPIIYPDIAIDADKFLIDRGSE